MRTLALLLLACVGCTDGSELSRAAADAEVRAIDAEKKVTAISAELEKMSAEIKAVREEQLLLRSRLAVQEKRLAEASLPDAPPAIDHDAIELEYLEEQYGRLDPLKQQLAKDAAARLSRGNGTRQDAIYLEDQIGSNKLSDAFFEKNGEDLGALREALD